MNYKYMLHNITLTSDLPTRDHVTGHVTGHVISDLFGFYCSFGLFGICMHFGWNTIWLDSYARIDLVISVYSYLRLLPQTFGY